MRITTNTPNTPNTQTPPPLPPMHPPSAKPAVKNQHGDGSWKNNEITSQKTAINAAVSLENKGFDYQKNREKIYNLMHKSASILNQKVFNPETNKTRLKFRVGYCKRTRIDANQNVFVFVNNETKKAQYGNLITCSDLWTCPHCANRITTVRGMEILHAVAQAPAFAFLTVTSPHNLHDRLADTLALQKIALQKFWRQRSVREMLANLGVHGRISTSEVKWGSVNGWHPHEHILLFMDKPLSPADMVLVQKFLASEWKEAYKKARETKTAWKSKKLPSMEHGLDIKAVTTKEMMENIADYIAKHGCMPAPTDGDDMGRINHEMTKWHTKTGYSDSYTPWDLLTMANPDDPNCNYSRLFKEYANAYRGKRQLVWSRGLKARYGVGEKTDDEIAQETSENATVTHEIAVDLWRLVVARKERAKVLNLAEKDHANGTDDLYFYLLEISADYIRNNMDDENLYKIHYEVQKLKELLYQSPPDLGNSLKPPRGKL